MENSILLAFALFGVLNIILGFWVNRARPSSEILKKYSKKVRFCYTYPFFNNWKKEIHPEDLEVFENFQIKSIILFILLIAMIAMFLLYGIFNINNF